MELLTYLVTYIDDHHVKHITIVKGMEAIRFIKARFLVVDFYVVENVEHKEVELVW